MKSELRDKVRVEDVAKQAWVSVTQVLELEFIS